MSVTDAETAFTAQVKALVVYHVAGYPADLAALQEFCVRKGIVLIEDANNAIGARTAGVDVGTVGDYAVFSFYANRQVNAIDGAILVCKNETAAESARRMRRFGIHAPSFRNRNGEIDPLADVPAIGMSSPLNNVNAVLARHGLELLESRRERTRRNVDFFHDSLSDLPGFGPVACRKDAQPSFWVWLTLCDDRDKLLMHLQSQGVQCSKLHQPNHVYTGFGARPRHLPGTAQFMEKVLAIPCGWWLDNNAKERIVAAIRRYFGHAVSI
jgi:dTDP-4-amino-4,6-dideoxygalactose transaminase